MPTDAPPGDYGVQLVLYDDEGGALPIRTADGRNAATPPVVGRLQVPARSRGDPQHRRFRSKSPARNKYVRGELGSPELLVAGSPPTSMSPGRP
jgi:hypothetical protein